MSDYDNWEGLGMLTKRVSNAGRMLYARMKQRLSGEHTEWPGNVV